DVDAEESTRDHARVEEHDGEHGDPAETIEGRGVAEAAVWHTSSDSTSRASALRAATPEFLGGARTGPLLERVTADRFCQRADGGPGQAFRARSRSLTFWILPVVVIGNSSTNATWRGILKLATRPRQCSMTSRSPSAQPGASCTKATATSDSRGSG